MKEEINTFLYHLKSWILNLLVETKNLKASKLKGNKGLFRSIIAINQGYI